ncbi:MAG TPA: hypothetical protein K8V11_12370 [Dietzia timorensis]|uniref:Macro domain-containing protein n=1 Tax=Dietzia timorensis TaxID=499555 RepID=A0A921K075_9ACTN|nr:hypothetical protein [Dietzia timorensis]HJE91791.1 hypothetical protein [Dietzia timorensis]
MPTITPVLGDIATERTDAIVNAASTAMRGGGGGGGGVDSAVARPTGRT